MLSRFFCCLRMILQKFDSFYTFWTGGILDFQNQQMNASQHGSSHRQICSRLRYSQIIVYWSRHLGISVISVYSGVMDPAPGHQPPRSQQVRLHHQPQGQGDHHDELSHDIQDCLLGPECAGLWRVEAGAAAGGDHGPGLVQLPGQDTVCSEDWGNSFGSRKKSD